MTSFPPRILWIGEVSKRPLRADRSRDFVLDSVIHHYRSGKPKLVYKCGSLFLDSGAFTAAMRDIVLDRERVLYIQERLWPDLAVPLDYPLKPSMMVDEMRNAWKKTAENILYWQNNSSLTGRTVPTLHSWDKRSLVDNINWIAKHADAEYLAIGVVVNPDFSGYSGFFKDRQPRIDMIRMLSRVVSHVREKTDFKIHAMGLGSSPLMLHLAYYLGVESIDTVGYRRKAAFGKIILPGIGERYVGNRQGEFGRRRLSKRERELLVQCSCEVCSTDVSRLWSDWRARALHNEHVMKLEAKKALELLNQGLDTYERYLERVFAKSKYGLDYLWRYARLLRRYKKLGFG